MEIVIYSTPTCPFCQLAKEYFKENNIPFTDYNVAEDEAAALAMEELSDQQAVPVIKIGDNVIVGFNRPAIEAILGK